jgi:SAM-dependent methyltransferase
VLELGCGTGRVSIPLARAGVSLVGVDRSASMLKFAAGRAARLRRRQRGRGGLKLIQGDVRSLPFARESFQIVLAPYGMLQSLLTDRDLRATLKQVAQVLRPGGIFGVDLVPDVPNWREYKNDVTLRGRASGGRRFTLIESVRQDRRKRLTIFEQRYRERRGRSQTEHRFELRFRTLPVNEMTKRLEAAGFSIRAVLGDYRGGPWDLRADACVIIAAR